MNEDIIKRINISIAEIYKNLENSEENVEGSSPDDLIDEVMDNDQHLEFDVGFIKGLEKARDILEKKNG